MVVYNNGKETTSVMTNDEFTITTKQAEVLGIISNSPLTGIEELFLIGPIGSTKTFVMAYADINIAYQFPGSAIPVGRKDAAEHQFGTFSVYLEVLDEMGMIEGTHFTLRQAPNDMQIRFANKSQIKFIGMNPSRDRQGSKLKITATKASIDEADDVDKNQAIMLQSRTGRKNKNGAPRITTYCCNPNEAWIKWDIYLPWLKRINRRPDNIDDQEWEQVEPLDSKIEVVEFQMEDSPLYPTGYYDRFLSRPINWVKRFLRNDWFYQDDEDALFKMRSLDRLTTNILTPGAKYIAIDPNAGGKDRAAIALWEDNAVVDIEVYTTEDIKRYAGKTYPDMRKNEDLKMALDPFNPGLILGYITLDMMEREGVGAYNVIGDVVGVGQGWLTFMLGRGYKVQQFKAGAAPYQTPEEELRKVKPPYDILRSQMYYLLSLDVDNARVRFYSDCPHISTLKKELQYHNADATSKTITVTSKDVIKKDYGASPDIADAVMMGYYLRLIRLSRGNMAKGIASVGKSVDELYNNGNGYY